MNIDQLFSRTVTAGFAAALLVLAGCAASTPTIDTSPEAEVTFDGLYEVKGGSADQSWARPDVDLSQYSKIMLQGAGIEYRPGGESGRSFSSRTRPGPYEVTEQQKAAFRQIVVTEFLKELALSEHFTLVEEPGPDVLLIRGALLDVVSYVPPQPTSNVAIYISKVAEATLVIELRDSITETILARAVDRRAAEDLTRMSQSTRVRNNAEIRRMAGVWGRLLRERLDQFAAPKE